ncbi:MAG TPA: FtsX-like permease family protein [Ktedonobacterales bacterium]|nr:FtsX-like permease family protein [Ktedonobacterales bacterium]
MKLRMYWSYATRSQLRGGQRSLLAIFCIAIGVMAIVALQLVSNAISLGLTGDIRALNGGDLAITSASAPLTPDQLGYFDTLVSQGAITEYTAVDSISGEFHVVAHGASRFFQVNAVNPARFPLDGVATFSDSATGSLSSILHGNTVVITDAMAKALGIRKGDTEHLYTRDGRSMDVTVGGILQNAGFFRGSMLLINLADFAAQPAASGQPVTYSVIYANVPGHTDTSATSAEKLIQGRFPLASIQTTKQALAGNQATVQQIEYFLQIVGLLALLIGGVGIVNTMQVLLRRRRVEIAMLKTAGYRRGDLYAMFGLEAGLIGLAGGIVGTAAGVGVSFLVKGLLENSLQFAITMAIDARTLIAGVAVGFVTALIFGLLPIIQAGQVRPQAVLRELPERAGWKSRIPTAALLVVLVALFFALSLSILRNAMLAIFAVGGTAIFLGLLSLFLGVVVVVISKLPVLESFRWWYALLVGIPLLIAIALTALAPAFGVLCLVVVLMGVVVALLPRNWKANVKLALRNIGRQKARTVTTLLALYIGVFAIGLILILGQNISTAINAYLISGNALNAEVLAGSSDKAAVEQQLSHVSDVRHLTETSFAAAIPVMVNGQPVGDFVRAATASGTYTPEEVVGVMNGLQGYDLAHGMTPDPVDVPLVSGRTLTASDAATTNALLPLAASQTPSNLKLGETVTLVSQADTTPVTVTIVGFYNSKIPQAGPILTDGGVVSTLSAGNPQYSFRMHLTPSTTDATLAKIQDAVPGITTFNFTDFANQYATQLSSLITVLVAVTSLAMLAAIVIIANAVALAMLERRRELGILKAVGHTSRSVLGEVMMENGIVAFTGALLALVVVVAAAATLGKVAFNLPIAIPTPTVLGVVAATVSVCVAVAMLVAWRATRARPGEVLRYE